MAAEEEFIVSDVSSEELDESLCEYEVQRLANIKESQKNAQVVG